MDNAFDVDKHIARIGARLVQEFDEARAATSPTAVGDAMESPVRKQLEHLLPRGIAVGSGFVIDSYGATSSQTDLVQKWLRKSEQGDKWNRCLIEGMIVLSETGARDEQTTPP